MLTLLPAQLTSEGRPPTSVASVCTRPVFHFAEPVHGVTTDGGEGGASEHGGGEGGHRGGGGQPGQPQDGEV